jgi:hypothetical protein
MAKDPYCEVYKVIFARAETHGRQILGRRTHGPKEHLPLRHP